MLLLIATLTALQVRPLFRPCIVGLVGDHDGDGIPDYAVVGSREPQILRVFSGRDDRRLAQFDLPAEPPCGLHDTLGVEVAGDLNGDGAFELACNDEESWLVDGRSGTPLARCPRDFRWLGSIGDLDGDGVSDPIACEGAIGLHRTHGGRAVPWSGHELRPLANWSLRTLRESERLRVLRDDALAELTLVGVCEPVLAKLIEHDVVVGNLAESTPHVVLEQGGRELLRKEFLLTLADTEYGGFAPFGPVSPGDLDGDGLGDLVLALPASAFCEFGSSSVLRAYSTRDGRELWRAASAESESLHPRLELLPDRDGDGVPELIACAAGGSGPSWVVVLSGASGRVLARFQP